MTTVTLSIGWATAGLSTSVYLSLSAGLLFNLHPQLQPTARGRQHLARLCSVRCPPSPCAGHGDAEASGRYT